MNQRWGGRHGCSDIASIRGRGLHGWGRRGGLLSLACGGGRVGEATDRRRATHVSWSSPATWTSPRSTRSRAFCDTCQIFMSAVYQTLIGVDPADQQRSCRVSPSRGRSTPTAPSSRSPAPDATFSDGSPVEAADVKFSWERLKNSKVRRRTSMSGVTTIEAPDDQTVVVTLEAPNSEFLNIVSRAVHRHREPTWPRRTAPTADDDRQRRAVVPRATRPAADRTCWSRTPRATSCARPQRRLLGRPRRRSRGSPLSRSRTRRRSCSCSRRATPTSRCRSTSTPSAQLEGVEDVTTEPVDSFNFVYLALSPGGPSAARRWPTRVREAIRMAIDYDGLIDTTVGGKGKLQASPIPNGFAGSEGLTLPEHDLDGAKQLLAEAGVDGLHARRGVPDVNVYGVDFSTMMAEGPAGPRRDRRQSRAGPVEFSGVGRADHRRRHPGHRRVLRAGPLRLEPIRPVLRPGRGRNVAGAGRAPSRTPTEADLFNQALATSRRRARRAVQRARPGDDRRRDHPAAGQPGAGAGLRPATSPAMHYSACCNLDLDQLGRG